MSVLNSLSQLGLLIVLSLITHNVPVMQTLSPQYLNVNQCQVVLNKQQHICFLWRQLIKYLAKQSKFYVLPVFAVAWERRRDYRTIRIAYF